MKLIDCGELQKALLSLEKRKKFNLENVLELVAALNSHSACYHDLFVIAAGELRAHNPPSVYMLYDDGRQIIFEKQSFLGHVKRFFQKIRNILPQN